MNVTWDFEHHVDTRASRGAAWAYWSDFRNQAEMEGVGIELDGPFQSGTKGRTIHGDSQKQEWMLREVVPEQRCVIVGEQSEVTIRFSWTFEDAETGTRLTQHINAIGPAARMEQWSEMFQQMETGAPKQMARLAATLDQLADAG